MTANVHFHRYDHLSTPAGFTYRTTDKLPEMEYDLASVSMNKIGLSLYVNVQNYTGETVFLGGNLRSTPTRIQSLQREGYRHSDHQNNFVIIQIFTTENIPNVDTKKRTVERLKTEIRIPSRMLNTGSVFIKELDCYVMTEAQIDATRELIARDVQYQGWDYITVPEAMMKTDPGTLYGEYKPLAEFCIKRQDKISLRIGIDLQYDNVPDIIKEMKVAILDSYFSPFKAYKLVYDPTLGPDDFVLENLHQASNQSFRSTWSELEAKGTMYLDPDEVDTLFGKFYGLVLFSGEKSLINYVHARKSEERFSDDNLYVSNRTGDPLLRERVANYEQSIKEKDAVITEQANQLQASRTELKRVNGELVERERTINQLRTGHAAKMSTEVVIGEIANERGKQQNERDKIYYDTKDLDQRVQSQPMAHRANVWKIWGDMIKSSWAIVAAITGGVLSTIALLKKHNVKLTS